MQTLEHWSWLIFKSGVADPNTSIREGLLGGNLEANRALPKNWR